MSKERLLWQALFPKVAHKMIGETAMGPQTKILAGLPSPNWSAAGFGGTFRGSDKRGEPTEQAFACSPKDWEVEPAGEWPKVSENWSGFRRDLTAQSPKHKVSLDLIFGRCAASERRAKPAAARSSFLLRRAQDASQKQTESEVGRGSELTADVSHLHPPWADIGGQRG